MSRKASAVMVPGLGPVVEPDAALMERRRAVSWPHVPRRLAVAELRATGTDDESR